MLVLGLDILRIRVTMEGMNGTIDTVPPATRTLPDYHELASHIPSLGTRRPRFRSMLACLLLYMLEYRLPYPFVTFRAHLLNPLSRYPQSLVPRSVPVKCLGVADLSW
jgi:hypothetical protein